MNAKKYMVSAAACLLCPLLSHAQDDALSWMARPVEPASVSMPGLSLTSSSDMSFSAFRNPGTVPFSADRMSVAASWSMSGKSEKSNAFGAGAALKVGKRVGIALAGIYGPGEEYEVIDDYGFRNGSFRTSSMLFSAGVGVKVIDALSLGVNLKYAGEKLAADSKPGAFASDIYATFRMKGLGAAAGVSNVGTSVKDDSGASFSLPSAARLEVGYGHGLGARHFLEGGIDAAYFFAGDFSASAGVQYVFNDMLFVRAGGIYSGYSAVPSCGTVGAGVKFAGVKIDVACQVASDWNALAVSVGYAF